MKTARGATLPRARRRFMFIEGLIELHLAPSLLLNPGEEGSIAVDDVELIVVASGFEGQGCSQTVQRSRTRTTRRTSE